MYLGIDVGGTKTLVAALSDQGKIVEQAKFPTPIEYDGFKLKLEAVLAGFKNKDFKAGGIGSAGMIDRKNGRLINWTNIPWKDIPLQADLEKLAGCPMVLENDAKMGGLSEAMLLKDQFSRVLYIAIGTGIGIALIVDCKIDSNFGDGGGRALMLEHQGKLTSWEEFASGRALVERFGKEAADITDEAVWQSYSRDLSQGLLQLIAMVEPDCIVIGGSVGRYFGRFSHFLKTGLEKHSLPLVTMPNAVLPAKRPEEAVIFGCYDLAKQVYGHA